MDRNRFFRYSAIGGLIWAFGNGFLGYWLGNVSFVRNNLTLVLIAIVIVSWIPIVAEGLRIRRDERRSTESDTGN